MVPPNNQLSFGNRTPVEAPTYTAPAAALSITLCCRSLPMRMLRIATYPTHMPKTPRESLQSELLDQTRARSWCLLARRAGTAGIPERFGAAAARTPRHACWPMRKKTLQPSGFPARTRAHYSRCSGLRVAKASSTNTRCPRGRRSTSPGLGSSTGWFSSGHAPGTQHLLHQLRKHIWTPQREKLARFLLQMRSQNKDRLAAPVLGPPYKKLLRRS